MFNLRNYAKGTWTEQRQPWGTFTRAKAICPDGKARIVRLSACADTFFSITARLSYKGRTVSGFISFASDNGLLISPEQWVRFTPSGKHEDIFAKETQP